MQELKSLLKNHRYLSVVTIGIVMTVMGFAFHWTLYLLGVPILLFVILPFFAYPMAEYQDKKRKIKSDQRWADYQTTRALLNEELTQKMQSVFFLGSKQNWTHQEINTAFKDRGIDTQDNWNREHDVTITSVLKLNDIDVEWCDSRDLRSINFDTTNGVFHGRCEVIYSWGRVEKNYVNGQLHGRQKVFVESIQALTLNYAQGHFESARFKTKWGQVSCFASGQDKLGYRLEMRNNALEFITSRKKPDLCWRRTLTDPDRLEKECRITDGVPNGEVIVTLNAKTFTFRMQGFKMTNVTGIDLHKWLGVKSMWSAWAFLYYDYRYCLGNYDGFILYWAGSVIGPPAPPAQYLFDYTITSLVDFFDVPGNETHIRG